MTPLMEFFGMDPEEAMADAEMFGAAVDPDVVPEEKWFTAEEGLRTVRALLRQLRATPGMVASQDEVVSDLRDLELLLDGVGQRSPRWHLGGDY